MSEHKPRPDHHLHPPAADATVVVCEDDEATLELLCEQLRYDRFEPVAAASAADALRHCHYRAPDLLILDLGLPDAPGLEVLRAIRGAEPTTGRFDRELPVIVLSGLSGEADRVRGLEAGADDYLVKPFHPLELSARIRAVMRRRTTRRSGPIRVGDLAIDPARRVVTVDGAPVTLANKEYELLLALAAEPHRVFTKSELLRDVWDFKAMGRTRTLDSHASRLRRKLDPDNGRFVSNCWGVGYRLLPA